MAEQISRRANNVTSAGFESPFETHLIRFGANGLNLKDSLDAMEGWSRMTNVWHENEGEATTRPGQVELATFAATTALARRGLTDQAKFAELARRERLRPVGPLGPKVTPYAAVNGWFPHVSPTGKVVSGSGQIYVDGALIDTGYNPKWLDANIIVYDTGAGTTKLYNVTTATPVATLPVGHNRFAADGGRWMGLEQAGPIYTRLYTGTTLDQQWTGRGGPAISPDGSWGNYDNFFADNHTVYVDGASVYTGIVMDVSLSSTQTCLLLATGTYTRQVLVLPSINCSIQSWEAPQILDGPGEGWILSLLQVGMILRPVGSQVGYHWGGDYYNPHCRFVGGVFKIAFSNSAGVPGVITVDPASPRVDLITLGPAPGEPPPPGGPGPGPIPPPGEVDAGITCHSIRKLRDPHAGDMTRVWGIDDQVRLGPSGAVDVIEAGFSGDPLTFVPHRPHLSDDPWMFVADSVKMRKIRADGLNLPIGLPAPPAPASAPSTEFSRTVVLCEPLDDTDAAHWFPAPGQDGEGTASGTPVAMADDHSPDSPAIYGITNPGAAQTGYDSWWGIALTRDLSILTEVGGDGSVPASDQDICHILMKTSHPEKLAEVRLYIVCSEDFDPLVLPGTVSDTGDNTNSDAYVKAFRPNDYIQFVQAETAQVQAAEQARIYGIRDADAARRAYNDTRQSWEDTRAQSDTGRAPSLQIGSGSHQWYRYGAIGAPFRRGDFQRIGSTAGRNWSTVTGVIYYVRTLPKAVLPIGVGLDDVYFTGGFGPDTAEPGMQQYDYRATHYDPRTGAEGNGSPEQEPEQYLDTMRRGIQVTPASYGDPAMRQRIYRRGGSLFDDWYYCGQNNSDGGAFLDRLADFEIAAAGTMPIDHYEPIPTVRQTASGEVTVLAQPLPALWGPLEGMLFGCGDPYRPGHLYFSYPEAVDHWSASGNVEVCPPSEELMHGGLLGHQGFVFSRARLYFIYPNLSGQLGGVTCSPGLCTRGLLGRWAFCLGPGGYVFFVAEDGVFATTGGPEEWLSEAINPLFYGTEVNGYKPIDKAAVAALRLTVWENALYFQYQDIDGDRQVMVFSLLQKFWRHYHFGRQPAVVQGEDEDILLIGGATTGKAYTHEGENDDGLQISALIRTGSEAGGRREEKLFGDIFLDADPDGCDIDLQVFLNEEVHANATIPVIGTDLTERQRFLVHAFGESPQKAHSIATELRWSAADGQPTLFLLGYAITLQPDLTNTRVTNWDDLNSPDEVWLTGVTLDCDTGGLAKTFHVERDFGGVRTLVATFDVTANNRHKFKFSWLAVPANQVRIRPEPGDCVPWLLYRADWIYVQEPPRISKWDIHFENAWDQYYTGLDLYCDTLGAEKRIEVWVDEQRILDPHGGGRTYWPIVANGRRVVHLTLPWGRGHVFRFFAIDDNVGLLYTHRWHLQEEPSEQANWNQNFSVLGTRADKWLKAVIFECDTFGQTKAVQIEVDGRVVETLTVATVGRRVVQLALKEQALGRVWRMYPVDSNPGRLYSAEPLFDEEPFQLDRWETQETNHGLPGWFYPLYAHITLKSSADVTLRTVMQHNQVGGQTTRDYVIPATSGLKQRRFLHGFHAGKGVLIKYILTSCEPFWLYRDETTLAIQPWGAHQSVLVQPFGNDDQDAARPMTHAVLAAQASGGATQQTAPGGGGGEGG